MTTIAHERRLSSLEKSIPAKRKGGFEGAIQSVIPPLRNNDRRLRNGVEEFEFVILPDTTKFPGKEKTRSPLYFAVVHGRVLERRHQDGMEFRT